VEKKGGEEQGKRKGAGVNLTEFFSFSYVAVARETKREKTTRKGRGEKGEKKKGIHSCEPSFFWPSCGNYRAGQKKKKKGGEGGGAKGRKEKKKARGGDPIDLNV